MPVTDVRKDPEALTMTVMAEYDAAPERVWQLWADPRQLERWWGPPTHPATVVEHELAPGGKVTYYMTAPEGNRYYGWWRVIAVDAPRTLEVEDGFAAEDGTPNPDLPSMRMLVTLEARAGGGTRMSVRSRFPSAEAMKQILAMGVEEGMRAAMGQIDALLA